MKTKSPLFALTALATALALASCSSNKEEGQSESTSMHQPGVPGGVRVQTFKTSAKVTAIDPVKRTVTMVTPNGKKTTFKAGPEITNFEQIRVGDQIKATVVEELVVYLRPRGAPRTETQASIVGLAPEGAKPGVLLANTVEVIARVKSVDLKNHKATLEYPDGSSHVVAVRPDVDLTNAQIGQEVVIQTTESVAISVEKP